jgi:hypothetical protein
MRPLALILILALLLPAASATALIIDTFENHSATSANGFVPNSVHSRPAGSFLGSPRHLESHWISGPNATGSEINGGGSSLLDFTVGAGTQAWTAVRWLNIGGVDITEGGAQNAIGLDIVFDDQPATITIILRDSLNNTSTASTNTSGGIIAPTQEAFLFSSFAGSVDVTDIERIDLTITSLLPDTNMQIDLIESTFVPEPSTATLLGISLIGLGLKGRRNRKLRS